MDLSNFRLQSYSDPQWMNDYISKMGESKFWHYKNKLYSLLYKMKVGEYIMIEDWCEPEAYDLFVKICCCFISESKCSYEMNNKYTIIKRQFDARKVESILTLLRENRRNKETGGDGTGTGTGVQRTLPVPPSESSLQGQY